MLMQCVIEFNCYVNNYRKKKIIQRKISNQQRMQYKKKLMSTKQIDMYVDNLRQKLKDNSDEQQKLQQLKFRNQSIRESHKRQLEQIQKAIYLVKLDDARQAKNISMEHRRRIQEMQQNFLQSQKQRKQKISDETAKAKQRYMKYWKEKLSGIYLQQAQTIADVQQQKQIKKQEMKLLQQQQIKLMEQMNKFHTQQIQTKKQYLAALSLPVKDVAQAMGQYSPKPIKDSQKRPRNKSSLDFDNNQIKTIDQGGLRLPNANVNQAKLKLILNQLKKTDKQKSSLSFKGSY